MKIHSNDFNPHTRIRCIQQLQTYTYDDTNVYVGNSLLHPQTVTRIVLNVPQTTRDNKKYRENEINLCFRN